MKNHKYFISGIDTNIGKTIISAMLVEKLNAEYWKPIQSGDLDNTDSNFIRKYTNCKLIHPERYLLSNPISPHAAAKIDKINIKLNDINLPKSDSNLIVEGAGGLMVPLNDNDLIIDLIKKLNMKVIIVSKNYLGSINHTLLTIEVLKNNNIKVKGIIFNGYSNSETERIIKILSEIKIIGRIPMISKINKLNISKFSKNIQI